VTASTLAKTDHDPGASLLGTRAVVLEAPERLAIRDLALDAPGDGDVVIDVEWSGISTGTERLLWAGRMPPFPGLGYPLVPGYETVGRVAYRGQTACRAVGERVFVPGARCFGAVRGLFGGAASRLVVEAARTTPVTNEVGEEAVLYALAATAHHALVGGDAPPDLIVGHGVLGRLAARLAIALGHPAPTVWERNPLRCDGATGYRVVDPDSDPRRDYGVILDASGDAALLDALIARLAPRGEIVLAGFYSERVSFAFPAAFMREARLRVAAEWAPADLAAVASLVGSGVLSLGGLITHRASVADAPSAYRTAFNDAACLKMILDWRSAP
jgi:bacteriochlorophyllide a dehydrogenase